jgi:hypothetical protein
LSYIFKNSVRFNADEKTLLNELQQLGLPKESALSVSKSYGALKGFIY